MRMSSLHKYIQTQFNSEDELEQVVVENAEYIFGPSSIYLPKKLITTRDGFGTIPDGFAIDVASRQWFIVEAELSKHSVWSHIAPQVAKQIIAANQSTTKQLLIELVVEKLRDNDILLEKFFDEGIKEIDIRGVLSEILSKKPVIGMPIDHISNDLKDWSATLKVDVKLWIVRKYVEFGNADNIMYEIPEEYRPEIDTTEETETSTSGIARYDVTIDHLMSVGLLSAGDKLIMSYKPKNGERKEYEATVEDNGSLTILGKSFSSPSYAALLGIQDAGSDRQTVNGWTSWRTSQGLSLADLRTKYLTQTETTEK